MFSIITVVIITAVIMLTGCRSVPVTGRNQFLMTGEEDEQSMGNHAWQELLRQIPKSANIQQQAALERVGKNIAAVTDKPDYVWRFQVFNNPQPNAFCLPGGKVGVYSGLFKFTDNDAELAAVVGHEIGHAMARHSGERMSYELLRQTGSSAVGVATGDRGWQSIYTMATEYGAIRPYSRMQEYEADHIGLILMAKAGYNPYAALTFWEKFSKVATTSVIGGYLSTHPRGENRIEELQEIMPLAEKEYQAAKVKRNPVIYRQSIH